MHDGLKVAESVMEAIKKREAVVALESTIITHGMPYPRNLETATAVEDEVRQAGAVPATIAVLNGIPHIGLTRSELSHLAQEEDVLKASRADLGFAIATGRTASTTVASTMLLAERAGIKVFATGGIGGVHRGATFSFDVSSDLQELATSNVIVVSAGAKAILDLPATLEVLETLGVPVVGYRTDMFPAFWSRSSNLPCPMRVEAVQDILALKAARTSLGLKGGVLITNPIPQEAAIDNSIIENAITSALAAAESAGIRGKAVTPFLLEHVVAATDGAALEANIALIRNNAKLAAEIALAFARNGKSAHD